MVHVRRRRSLPAHRSGCRNAPQLELALACRHQRIGLRACEASSDCEKSIAVLLGQPILLEGGCDFGAVEIGDRLTAPHALARVLHIELVDAPADPRADGGQLRLRLLHASKGIDIWS